MKLEDENVPYFPYTVTAIKQIDDSDIIDETLILPENASVIGENSLMPNISLKKVIIPSSNYQIHDRKIKYKLKPEFILIDGVEIGALFYNVNASKIVLPNTLKTIKKPEFQSSKIDELEIPDSVEICEDEVFKNSIIKKLIVHEKLLSQISAKYILTCNKKTTLIVKSSDEETREYKFSKLNAKTICSLGYIDEAIDMFVNSLFLNKINSDISNSLRRKLKIKFLKILRIKLLFGKLEYISINDLFLHDRSINRIIKKMNSAYHVPINISSDGFTIRKDNKKIKGLSLQKYLNKRY